MKYVIPLIFCFSLSLSAQDKIVTLGNDTVDCIIVDLDENFIEVIVDGKTAKMLFSSVLSVYQNDKWDYNENAFRFTEKKPVEESVMKRKPDVMSAGISDKQ